MSVHFGSINNTTQEQELIMLSRLIAWVSPLIFGFISPQISSWFLLSQVCGNSSCFQSCAPFWHQFECHSGALICKLFKLGFDSRFSQEICDGLNTVQSTLKTLYLLLPERIFFWLKADWTVISSLGVGLFSIATIVYNQVRQHAHFSNTCFHHSSSHAHTLHVSGTIRRWLSSRWRHSRLCKRHSQHILFAMTDHNELASSSLESCAALAQDFFLVICLLRSTSLEMQTEISVISFYINKRLS